MHALMTGNELNAGRAEPKPADDPVEEVNG